MHKIKKFNQLDKNVKVQHVAGYVVEIAFVLASIGLMIYYASIGDPNKRIMPALGSAAAFILPILLEQIFRFRLSLFAHIVYIVSMFYAAFLGCGFNMHATVGPFDEISHFLAGYISALAIFYILTTWRDYSHQKKLFIALVIAFVSMGTAALWELTEFAADCLLGTTGISGVSAEVVAEGEAMGLSGVALHVYAIRNSAMLWDSITDMALHLGGTMVFMIEYAVFCNIKTPLLLAYVEKDSARNKANYYLASDDECNVAKANVTALENYDEETLDEAAMADEE